MPTPSTIRLHSFYLKIAKNDQNWLNYVDLEQNVHFFTFFCDFQMHLSSTDFSDSYLKLKVFSSTLIAFCGIFVVFFISLRLIISDYFSSIFTMLNSHKKNGFSYKKVSPNRFWLNTSVFLYVMTYQMRTTLSRRCHQKNF